MKATDDDLREALGLSAPERTGRPDCPPADVLARAAQPGGVEGSRDEGVIEHVAGCAHCALEFRLAAAMGPWAEGAAAALRAPASARPPARTRHLALAASLAACAVLGGWALTLRQDQAALRGLVADAEGRARAGETRVGQQAADLARLGRERETPPAPVPNVPIVDLDPGAARGGADAPIVVRLPPATPWVTFVLVVPGGAGQGDHRLEIRDDDGGAVWSGTGLVANRYGTFTVAVPARLLPPGRYAFDLSRTGGGGETRIVQSYRVAVASGAP